MVMNGFDTNFDRSNEVYAVNSIPFAYMDEPIAVERDALVRLYLVNVLEYDLINSFHLHANFFDYFPTGTSLQPSEFTDTVMQCQGQRGILEMRFPHLGKFMFHAHQSEFAELGWMGFFEVCDDASGKLVCDLRDALMEAHADARPLPRRSLPAWLLGLVPLLLAVGVLGAFAALGGPGLATAPGLPVEELVGRAHRARARPDRS